MRACMREDAFGMACYGDIGDVRKTVFFAGAPSEEARGVGTWTPVFAWVVSRGPFGSRGFSGLVRMQGDHGVGMLAGVPWRRDGEGGEGGMYKEWCEGEGWKRAVVVVPLCVEVDSVNTAWRVLREEIERYSLH